MEKRENSTWVAVCNQCLEMRRVTMKKRYEEDCDNALDFNVCIQYLSYDILGFIFQHLNTTDLSGAAMVCRYKIHNILISTQFNTFLINNILTNQ